MTPEDEELGPAFYFRVESVAEVRELRAGRCPDSFQRMAELFLDYEIEKELRKNAAKPIPQPKPKKAKKRKAA